MRVEIHTLSKRGNPKLAGVLELRGASIQTLAEPGFEAMLENVVREATFRAPGNVGRVTAHTEPGLWLQHLHTHLRTPYLRAGEATYA